jgi:hypothetical protein
MFSLSPTAYLTNLRLTVRWNTAPDFTQPTVLRPRHRSHHRLANYPIFLLARGRSSLAPGIMLTYYSADVYFVSVRCVPRMLLPICSRVVLCSFYEMRQSSSRLICRLGARDVTLRSCSSPLMTRIQNPFVLFFLFPICAKRGP